MKKLVSFLFLLPVALGAQEATATPAAKKAFVVPVNEIGINFMSVENFNAWDLNIQPKFSAEVNVSTGLYYKRHSGQQAFRAAVVYYAKPFEQSLEGEYYSYHANGVSQHLGLSTGYEREFLHGRLRPFLFADAFFEYRHRTGTQLQFGCFGPYGTMPLNEESYLYGMAMGGGLKVLITKNLSATVELNGRGCLDVTHDLLYRSSYAHFRADLNPVSRAGLALSF